MLSQESCQQTSVSEVCCSAFWNLAPQYGVCCNIKYKQRRKTHENVKKSKRISCCTNHAVLIVLDQRQCLGNE